MLFLRSIHFHCKHEWFNWQSIEPDWLKSYDAEKKEKDKQSVLDALKQYRKAFDDKIELERSNPLLVKSIEVHGRHAKKQVHHVVYSSQFSSILVFTSMYRNDITQNQLETTKTMNSCSWTRMHHLVLWTGFSRKSIKKRTTWLFARIDPLPKRPRLFIAVERWAFMHSPKHTLVYWWLMPLATAFTNHPIRKRNQKDSLF